VPGPDLKALLDAGMNLLPMGVDKRPLVKWKDRQSKPYTLAELSNEYAELRPPMYSNITGQASGRFTLDFDGAEGRDTFARIGLDEPHRVTPGGGLHVDVAWSAGLDVPTLNTNNSTFLRERFPKMDLKGRGGYSLVIGTDHRGTYAWQRSIAPLPFADVERLMPDLVAHLFERQEKADKKTNAEPMPIATGALDEGELRRRMFAALASRPTSFHDGLLAVGRAFPDRPQGDLARVARIAHDVIGAARPGGRVIEPAECEKTIVDGWTFARENGLKSPQFEKRKEAGGDREIVTTPASAFSIETARFLDPERTIPANATAVLAGPPGLGKTTFATRTAARVSVGAAGYRSGAVLIISAEDSPSTTLVPRLKAEGADLDCVHFLEARQDGAPDGLVLPDDVDQIAKVVQEVGAVLVVIDPLNAHLSGSIDGHRDQDVRRALAPLHRMADELDVAVLVLAHLTKAPGNSPLNRVGGSIGIVGAARSVILLTAHPDDDGEEAFDTMNLRVVSHVKCNVGPLAGGFTYRVDPVTLHEGGRDIETSRLVLVGRTDLNADELLDPPRKKARTAVERAEAFLRDHLKDGTARPSEEVKAAAMDALGVSEATVKRALDGAQILTHRASAVRPTTTWQLAPGSQLSADQPTDGAAPEPTTKPPHLQALAGAPLPSQLSSSMYREPELTGPSAADQNPFGGDWMPPGSTSGRSTNR
jgi:hypothetical protein